MALLPAGGRPPLDHAAPLVLTDEEVVRLGAGGVIVRDGVLPPAEVAAARVAVAALDARDGLDPAGVGRDGRLRPEVRGDRITWLEEVGEHRALAPLFGFFEALRQALVEATWVSLPRFSVQLACYPGGGARYARHVDALPGDPNRRMTAILYLNEDWRPEHGGLLRAWEHDGVRELEPVGNRLVVFRSEAVPHEVLPSHAPRYAAAAWYRGPEAVPLIPDPDVVAPG